MEAFAENVPHRYPDALVLRGQCYENESLPFKALDSMMDDLSRQLRHLGSRLERFLPPNIAALARLFPVLERVDAIAEAVRKSPVRIPNVAELRRRAFQAFASLLTAITAERLIIIILDDLHRGDSDSAALFQHLFSERPIPSFALIAAYRAEETPSEFIKLWRKHVAAAAHNVRIESLSIGALDARAAFELARSLLARPVGAGRCHGAGGRCASCD